MRWKWLERWIQTGSLYLHMPDGETVTVGEGRPAAHIHLHRRGILRRLLQHPDIAVGEAYMDGDWSPGEGGLPALFELYYCNSEFGGEGRMASLVGRALRFVSEANGKLRARKNVHQHYDLDEELFRGFLDKDMQYSCAYFRQPDMSLEAAQRAKCAHIARKLCLSAGERVLDIGSGWGGLALFLAEKYDVEVTGLTLSDDQFERSRRRAAERDLADKVRFFKQDYREHTEHYDAIVSVGMFEHVGRPQYQIFFDQVHALLAADGRALIHCIGRSGPPAASQSWISRYIFPGGYVPSLSEVAAPLERSGLVLSDLEVWRLHYARTLHEWNARFQAGRERFKDRLGERFCRMWEFYLQGCEAIFTWGDLVVFQLQLAQRNDGVPLTRDYLYEAATSNAQQDVAA